MSFLGLKCICLHPCCSSQVVKYLRSKAKDESKFSRAPQPAGKPDNRRFFACDTEVAFIDAKTESPVR
jgi:hypothetical protein